MIPSAFITASENPPLSARSEAFPLRNMCYLGSIPVSSWETYKEGPTSYTVTLCNKELLQTATLTLEAITFNNHGGLITDN